MFYCSEYGVSDCNNSNCLTSNLSDKQYILEKLDKRCNEYELQINFKTTKLIVVKSPHKIRYIFTMTITPIENLKRYRYLGTWKEQSGDQTKVIKMRIRNHD